MAQVYYVESYFPDPNGPGGFRCDKVTIKASSDDRAIKEAKSFAWTKCAYFRVRRANKEREVIYNSRRPSR